MPEVPAAATATAANESTPLLTLTQTQTQTQSSEQRTTKMSNSSTSATTYWRVGAIYGAAAVCLGAFGAHGLKSRAGITDAKLASWSTAAHYQVGLSNIYMLPFPFHVFSLSLSPRKTCGIFKRPWEPIT